jgi:hypothetical protein
MTKVIQLGLYLRPYAMREDDVWLVELLTL